LNTTRNIEELMLRRYFAKLGVAQVTLNIVPIGFPEMLPALERDQVVVASIVEPFIEPAVRTGRFKILERQYLAVSKSTVVATYATSRKWLNEHPDAAKALLRAFARANDFLEKNDAECREILGSFTNIKHDDLPIIGMPAFEPKIHIDSLRELANEMVRYDFITSMPDMSRMIYQE
jgi:NitT/TauT family transport system substrate-binding protein